MENKLEFEKQEGFFETEDEDLPFQKETDRKDKEYYDVLNASEKYRKMKMENDLKAGELCYTKEFEKVIREICDVIVVNLNYIREVLPFEALGKGLEEIKTSCNISADNFMKKILENLKDMDNE